MHILLVYRLLIIFSKAGIPPKPLNKPVHLTFSLATSYDCTVSEMTWVQMLAT